MNLFGLVVINFLQNRRQPQYERVLKNRRVNLDLPADTPVYQLSREWVAGNPSLFPDHTVVSYDVN